MTPEELNSALKESIQEENIESVKNLLKQNAPLFYSDKTLEDAVDKDNIEFLKNLQSTKIKDAFSNTLLHYAAEKGKNELVKELILSDVQDFEQYKHERREKIIFPRQAKEIEQSIEKNKTETQEIQTKSLEQIKMRHLKEIEQSEKDMTKLFKEPEACYNQTNVYGNTPLHNAAIYGHLDIVKTLIDAGANPNLKGSNGHTTLELAVRNDSFDVVKELVVSSNTLIENYNDIKETMTKIKDKPQMKELLQLLDDKFVFDCLRNKIGPDYYSKYEEVKKLYPAYRVKEIVNAADILINDGAVDHIIDLNKIEQALKDKNFTNILKQEERTFENMDNVNQIMQSLDETHPKTYDEYLIKFANNSTFSQVIGERLEDLKFKDIKIHKSVDDNSVKESKKFSNNLKIHKIQNKIVSKEM
jgi:ankyrin repeat protein